jgi:hypothetical protein
VLRKHHFMNGHAIGPRREIGFRAEVFFAMHPAFL